MRHIRIMVTENLSSPSGIADNGDGRPSVTTENPSLMGNGSFSVTIHT